MWIYGIYIDEIDLFVLIIVLIMAYWFVHSAKNTVLYECDDCTDAYSTEKLLMKHIEEKHLEESELVKVKKPI